MTVQVITSSTVTSGTNLTVAADGDSIWVAPNVVVGSQTTAAISAVGRSNFIVDVYGTLVGGVAIDATSDAHDYAIRLRAGSNLTGFTSNTSSPVIVMKGWNRHIENAGTIISERKDAPGVDFIDSGTTGTGSSLVNTGTITGGSSDNGIYHYSYDGSEKLTLTNSGTISGLYSFSGVGNAIDWIVNTGRMIGSISTDGGNDYVDTRTGTVQGAIYLWTGNDTAYGSAAADFIDGGADNDVIRGGGGKDFLAGNAGIDLVDYSDKTQKVQLALNAGAAVVVVNGVTEDTISGFERVYGGSAGDAISGDSFGNLVYGNGGNDTLNGGSGNDTLRGGAGADIMDGGANTDLADYSDKTLGITVTLKGATATIVKVGTANEDTIKNFENVTGGSGADRITGDGLGNVLKGGVGKDILDGAGGYDTADYSEKAQKVTVALNGATAATVYVNGTAAANAEDSIRNIENVRGGSVGDKLTGDGLANTLYGNLGNDTLSGGGGADLLIGGQGSDSLAGGSGADHFRFAYLVDVLTGVDTITDFTHGSDRIEMDDPGRTVPLQVTSFASVAVFNSGTNATQFTYDQGSGVLYFDLTPGIAGGEFAFAVLTNHPALTASDLWWV